MNVSSWSIRNPVPAVLVFVLLTVLGIVGFRQLQIQDFPDMDLPTVQISATLEGAAPSQLETEVARKIEDKLASLSRLDHITTTITDGSVSISVSFEIDKDGEEALSEVRNAVDSARAEAHDGRLRLPDLHDRIGQAGRAGPVLVRRQRRDEGAARSEGRCIGRARRRPRP